MIGIKDDFKDFFKLLFVVDIFNECWRVKDDFDVVEFERSYLN